jgi:hypothetical protein
MRSAKRAFRHPTQSALRTSTDVFMHLKAALVTVGRRFAYCFFYCRDEPRQIVALGCAIQFLPLRLQGHARDEQSLGIDVGAGCSAGSVQL